MRAALLATLVALAGACAASHTPGEDDASTSHDGAVTHDGASSDAGAVADGAAHGDAGGGGGEHIVCGPNVCRSGEICCNERCGICAFASECVDYGCVGGPP